MEPTNQPWKGYTLDQIRVHRLVNLTKMEVEKTRLNHITQNYTSRTGAPLSSPIMGKLLGALDYVDYAVLAYRLGRRIFSVFRHKRR